MEGINASPAQILFGNSIDLDRGLLIKQSPNSNPNVTTDTKAQHLSKWMADMLKAQADIIHIAQEKQKKAHTEYFERFPTERSEFPVGSYVLVTHGEGRPKSKLHTYNRGPYRVVRNDPDNKNRYTVQNLVTLKLEDFPNGQLRPFKLDERHGTPEEIALMDDDLEIIDKVVSHSPKKLHGTSKGKITFKVLYVGDERQGKPPSTLPYEALRDNGALHEYLTKIKAISLIPARFKWGREGPPPGEEPV